MIWRRITVLLASGICAACAANDRVRVDSTAKNGGEETNIVLSALPEGALPKGECGMILWTLDADRPVPVFRYVAGKGANVVVNGAGASLTLIQAEGASGFGIKEEQAFTGPNGLTATVKTRFGLGFDGGSYLERSLISLENGQGWKVVIPAAGVAGCRAK